MQKLCYEYTESYSTIKSSDVRIPVTTALYLENMVLRGRGLPEKTTQCMRESKETKPQEI